MDTSNIQIEEAQHNILQVELTDEMRHWIKEQTLTSTNRFYENPNKHKCDWDTLLEVFEQTISFCLKTGINLGRMQAK